MIQVYTLPARYIYLLTSCISYKTTFLYQILIFFTFQSSLTFLTNYTLLHISKVVVTNLKEHTLTSCHTIFFFFLLSCHVSSSCLIHSSGSFHSKFGSLLVCSGQSQSRVIINGDSPLERDATQLFYSYLCNYCLGLILTILSSSLGCCLVVVNLKTRTRITTGT